MFLCDRLVHKYDLPKYILTALSYELFYFGSLAHKVQMQTALLNVLDCSLICQIPISVWKCRHCVFKMSFASFLKFQLTTQKRYHHDVKDVLLPRVTLRNTHEVNVPVHLRTRGRNPAL